MKTTRLKKEPNVKDSCPGCKNTLYHQHETVKKAEFNLYRCTKCDHVSIYYKPKKKKKAHSSTYLNYNGLLLSVGNLKIGNDTLILNMGSATDCPALKLGFCKLGKKCYAYKAEHMYPAVKPYRDRQANYWLTTSSFEIIKDFDTIASKHKKVWARIKYLRVNESGDFYSNECINKLSVISSYLQDHYNITTYTYTARKDLNFESAHFLVKGSSNEVGNNGKSIARDEPEFDEHGLYHEHGKSYRECKGDCRICTYCKEKNDIDICFAIH